LPVHPRHPYAGELVFTAFSGSHQDAIKKGFAALEKSNSGIWEVPYLPIDPKDLGRDYQAVIRINSQSGKGGIAYVMQQDYGFDLPRKLQIEFSQVIQDIADTSGKEIQPEMIKSAFDKEYLSEDGVGFVEHRTVPGGKGASRSLNALIRVEGKEREVNGVGNGPIDAFVDALAKDLGVTVKVLDYREHAVGIGADANAVAYVEAKIGDLPPLFGVGIDPNIVAASLRAVISAVNRAKRKQQ
jgi:2-isopropylmalate synthase